MRIAVIGAGPVGRALAVSFVRTGNEIVLGVREPNATQTAATDKLEVRSIKDAVAGAHIVVLAVPFGALDSLSANLELTDRQVLVDVTNRLKSEPLGLASTAESSGGETVQRLWPQARVVKAFNTTGFENLADPRRLSVSPIMPVAGDDAEAKALVLRLAEDAGWRALDAGPLANAHLLEALAMLWIWLAHPGGLGRDFGFAFVGPQTKEPTP